MLRRTCGDRWLTISSRNIQRENHFQDVLRPRERDVEQASLLFDFLVASGGHIGGNVPVGRVDDVNAIPLTSLGGMNGRKDEDNPPRAAAASQILRTAWRIEQQIGQHLPARTEIRADLLELLDVSMANMSLSYRFSRIGA